MTEFHKTAVLGAGVIGASWAALFLASGREVAVYDASPDAEEKVRAFVKNAWQTILDLLQTKIQIVYAFSKHRVKQ